MASYKEMIEQGNKLLADAEVLRKSELKEVIANIRSTMKEHGLTVEDLGLSKGTSTKAPASPKVKGDAKYANPANPSETYAGGRGAKPKWMKEYLAVEGHKIEDLLINK